MPQSVAERYLGETDFRFCSATVPVDPAFVQFVESLLGAWAVGKSLDYVYDRVKKPLVARLSRSHSGFKVIRMVGPKPESGRAILEIGSVRPAFHIQHGHKLVISDVTIRYVGSPLGLVKEDVAPSFVPVQVEFTQVRRRSSTIGLYQIHTPIWVGSPEQNPYDQRSHGGPVLVFDMSEAEARRKGIAPIARLRDAG
jgi:hypothetical protein